MEEMASATRLPVHLSLASAAHVYLSSRDLDGARLLLRRGDLPCRCPATILDDVLVSGHQRDNGNLPVTTVGGPAFRLLNADDGGGVDVNNGTSYLFAGRTRFIRSNREASQSTSASSSM
jgi:hypothetical protein